MTNDQSQPIIPGFSWKELLQEVGDFYEDHYDEGIRLEINDDFRKQFYEGFAKFNGLDRENTWFKALVCIALMERG